MRKSTEIILMISQQIPIHIFFLLFVDVGLQLGDLSVLQSTTIEFIILKMSESKFKYHCFSSRPSVSATAVCF